MTERNLQHIYQAWQQGNEHYVRDWAKFVEHAARCNRTTGDIIMKELQKYYWFKWIPEDLNK
jgi:hypothetical protein